MRRFWTSRDLNYIRKQHGKKTTTEIATDLGRSRRSIWQTISKLGLARPKVRLAAVADRLRGLVSLGWCNRHIARDLGSDRQVVRLWRRRLGLPDLTSGGSVDSCLPCKEQVRRNTARQLQQAGLKNLAEVRSLVFARRAQAAGWPAECRPREVQILDLLWAEGAKTRKEIAAAVGMPWKGSRKSLVGNVPGGSYLAHLIRLGLVVRVATVGYPYKGGDGRGRRETYYDLSPGVTKGQAS